MALTSDYRNCFVSDWSKEDHEFAKHFCWVLMSLDIGEVKAKNLKEITFRLNFLKRIGFPVFNTDETHDYVIKYLDKWVGYKTNIKEEPRFKFIRRWIKGLERDLEEKLSV